MEPLVLPLKSSDIFYIPEFTHSQRLNFDMKMPEISNSGMKNKGAPIKNVEESVLLNY